MGKHILRYFAGGNTAHGFYSLYETNLMDTEKIFVLNGGTLASRTELLQEITDEFAEVTGCIHYLHSAADSEFLEGVILDDIGVAIIDGTAPRKIDLYPAGKKIRIIDLGMENGKADLHSKMESAYQEAYRAFKEALKIHDEWEAIFIDNMDFGRADELTGEVMQLLLQGPSKPEPGKAVHRFLGAATPTGAVDFIPELTEGLPNRYLIKGRPGSGKSTMLRQIAARAESEGYDVEIYHCGFDPNSLDMVIVRELGFAIFDSTAPHEYFPEREGDSIIDVYDKCIREGTDEDYKTDIEHISGRYRSKMGEATAWLAQARDYREQYEAPRGQWERGRWEMCKQDIIREILD
ncbi:MAG: hypothetical protein ACI4XL_05685 [Bacillus sp. (in: firmicutes)]